MIVDPKIQNMLERCREQKQHIDRMINLIRSGFFLPPAGLAVMMLINSVSSVLTGFVSSLAGGDAGSPPYGPVSIIMTILLAVYAACYAMLNIRKCVDISGWFYPSAAGACTIAAFIFQGEMLILFGLALYSIGCIFLNLLFKKFRAEDELMKPLKGYPHFNPLLMNERDLKEKDTPDRKPPDDMTPDERLMFERDNNM